MSGCFYPNDSSVFCFFLFLRHLSTQKVEIREIAAVKEGICSCVWRWKGSEKELGADWWGEVKALLVFCSKFVNVLGFIKVDCNWNQLEMCSNYSFYVCVQVSSMGITPFFVENVSELQLCAIKLVTAVSIINSYF